MRTLRIPAAVLLLAAAACGGSTSQASPTPAPRVTRTSSPTSAPTPTASAPASVVPSGVPSGTPASYAKDVDAANLPPAAFLKSGTASDNVFSVRALAFITAGHVLHHTVILRERYQVGT